GLRNDPAQDVMAAKPTLEAVALLGEFGFEFVAPDQVGEPTPGRIADRLTEIITALEEAIAQGNLASVQQATEKLKRLQGAIDVWSLLSAEFDDGELAPEDTAAPPAPTWPPPAQASTPPSAQPPPAQTSSSTSGYPPPSVPPGRPIDVQQLELTAT